MQRKATKGDVPSLSDDYIEQLRRALPSIFSEGKVDLNALQIALGEHLETSAERFAFTWSGKRNAMRIALSPAKTTLTPLRKESLDFDSTKNLFIEGDNLEVLKLLYKPYYGRIKMIYIDPPYNTGNDFVYSDNYTNPLQTYLELTGQKSVGGKLLTTNPETSGRYHSSWLSMMYPRLYIAMRLLCDDGLIFVSIDDHEFQHLRIMMNEIFGEENFVATFVWRRRASSALAEKLVSVDHEYVIVYQRGNFLGFRGEKKDYANYRNPDHDPKGPWTLADLTVGMTKEQRPNQFYDLKDPKTEKVYPANPNRVWGFIPETMSRLIDSGRVVFPEDTSKRPMLKRYQSDLKTGVNPISTWMKGIGDEAADGSIELRVGLNAEGTRTIQELFGEIVFNYSKPVSLIKSFAKHCTTGQDIILDPFAGSCTTAQAVLELNREDGGDRSYICIQLPEPLPDTKKLQDGTLLKTISDVGEERIRRVSRKLNEDKQAKLDNERLDLGFRAFTLTSSNCFAWDAEKAGDLASLTEHLEEGSSGANKAEPEALAFELMLREGLPLSTELQYFQDKKNRLYQASNGESTLWMCFDKVINDTSIGRLPIKKDDKLLVLDSSLSDTQKVNLARKIRVETF